MFNNKVNVAKISWDDTSVGHSDFYTVQKASFEVPVHPVNLAGQRCQGFIPASSSDIPALIDRIVDAAHMQNSLGEFELTRRNKVGKQGKSFGVPYLFEQAFTDFIGEHSAKDYLQPHQADARAAELRAKLCSDQEYIRPYTYEEVALRLAKSTSCFGYTGKKNDPLGMHEALRDVDKPIDEFLYTLVGQRYQRNKKDAHGNPLPRIIFNPHQQFNLRMGRFIFPLIDAALRYVDGHKDIATPFASMGGPTRLGRAIQQWVDRPSNSGKSVSFWRSYNFDLKKCDSRFGRKALDCFVRVTEGMFPPELRQEYRDIVMAVLKLRVVFDQDHVLVPVSEWDCLFSGLILTNFAETVVHWALIRTASESFRAVLTVPNTGVVHTSYATRWDAIKVITNGDDVSLLVKVPNDHSVIGCRHQGVDLSVEEYISRVFNDRGALCAPDKCSTLNGALVYGMKHFSTAAVVGEGDEKRMLPVYSLTAALNAVWNPEMPAVTTDVEELKRVAMIMDQCQGHPRFNTAVDTMVQMMKLKHGDNILDRVTSMLSNIDEVFVDPLHRAYSFQTEEWLSTDSPFITLLCVKLGFTPEQVDNIRFVSELYHTTRRIMWQLRITPEDIQNGDPIATGRLLTVLQGEQKFGEGSDAVNFVDALGVRRIPKDYDHSRTFVENIEHDNPIDHYRSASKGKGSMATHVVVPESDML